MIVHERPAVSFLKSMLVNPKSVRAADLLVHKTRRRVPIGDLAAPAQRKSMNAQSMIHDRASTHLARARRGRPKMQPRRCDQIEILCIGKKREHFAAWLRQPKLRLENPDTHKD